MKALFTGLRAGDRVTLYLSSGAQIYGAFESIDIDARCVTLDCSFHVKGKNRTPWSTTRVLLDQVIAVTDTTDIHDRTKEVAP